MYSSRHLLGILLLFDKNRSEIIKEELSLKIKGLCLYADMERKQKDDSVNFTEENILTSLEKSCLMMLLYFTNYILWLQKFSV